MTMHVGQIIKAKGSGVVTTGPETTIAEVARILERENIGAVVVQGDGGRLAGIISERDIVRGLPKHGAQLLDMRVADLMTRSVVTCAPEDRVQDIMQQMTSRRFRHLPVVQDEKLLAIISIGDVVKNRLEELESETHMLRDYIGGHG
jgi:CBS domain-containing protein